MNLEFKLSVTEKRAMESQREYWDNRILQWEAVTYGVLEPRGVPLIERVADRFRGPVRHRRTLAYEIVKAVMPERVVELGCASGGLAISLVTEADINHVIGIDVSGRAIECARDRADSMGLAQNLTFIRSGVADLSFESLPPFDFVLGLGLIPYLTEMEFRHLFKSIKETPFWFDVHPKGCSYVNAAHVLYRMIKGHPFYNRYSREELLGKLADLGIQNVEWRQSQGVSYIQHRVGIERGATGDSGRSLL